MEPDRAYFGEKDFQQIAVIRNMVASEGIKVEIVACPIKRANDGLALSSRNALLSPAQRALAPSIHAALAESVAFSKEHSVRETHAMVVEKINAVDEMEVEYFEIVDARTLAAVEEWEESPGLSDASRSIAERFALSTILPIVFQKIEAMLIEMMKSKIHRVTVTEANLNYIGSITIDKALLKAANIREGERVFIVDNNNGERFDTYTIAGEEGVASYASTGRRRERCSPGIS